MAQQIMMTGISITHYVLFTLTSFYTLHGGASEFIVIISKNRYARIAALIYLF